MTQEQPTGPEHSEVAPPWDGKVLALNAALAESSVPYAFGGAIALNYHREPRSTLDIDINVFVEPTDRSDVLAALAGLYDVDQAKVGEELERDGQSRSLWGTTFVDLFFTDTDFQRSMAERISYQPFGEAQIPVISAEDLLVCKVLYDRPKDWLDIEAVAQTKAGDLDADYIRSWLTRFLGESDPKLGRVVSLLT